MFGMVSSLLVSMILKLVPSMKRTVLSTLTTFFCLVKQIGPPPLFESIYIVFHALFDSSRILPGFQRIQHISITYQFVTNLYI